MMDAGCDLELVTVGRATIAAGVTRVSFCSAAGMELPPWSPGDHLELILPNRLARSYSLCGDPSDRDCYEIAVMDEPQSRGGSRFVCRTLKIGDRLDARGPRSNFPFESSPRYLFIAGGIGVTPIRPMVAAAAAAGADWHLLYGARTRAAMAFVGEFEALGDRVRLAPQDETGLLDLDGWLAEPREDTLIYCCGPESLLQAVEQRCQRWPTGTLRVERFAAPELPASTRAEPFEVVLARTGKTLTVPPDKSILTVVMEAGVPILSSCGEGTCGTCETAVLEGVPDHRDCLLEAAEKASGDRMLICVSRSCTPKLVLDL
jgi:ferredoxin-NADP reductase